MEAAREEGEGEDAEIEEEMEEGECSINGVEVDIEEARWFLGIEGEDAEPLSFFPE